jgi:hypothetical protein
VVRDVKQQRIEAIQFPLEYHAGALGEYRERQSAQGRPPIFRMTAALGVLLILQIAIGS